MNQQAASPHWRDFRTRQRFFGQLGRMVLIAAVLVATALATTGCGLILEYDSDARVIRGYRYFCRMTVRTAAGPLGRSFEKDISSDDAEFAGRLFFICTNADSALCPSGCSTSVDDVIREWRKWVFKRIDDFTSGRATLAEFTSDFELFRSPWCEVEGTARCELGEPLPATAEPACPSVVAPLPDVTLELCPPSSIPCLGLDPLPGIDFGRVPVGQTCGPATLTIRNTVGIAGVGPCESADREAGQLRIRVAQDTTRGNPDDFVLTENQCAPRDMREMIEDRALLPMEECLLRVQFTPMRPSPRIGFIRIQSEGRFTRGTFIARLTGEGEPGRMSVDPDPVSFADASRDSAGCLVKDLAIRNNGPGNVRVEVPMSTPP
jgi:hypothetical protein